MLCHQRLIKGVHGVLSVDCHARKIWQHAGLFMSPSGINLCHRPGPTSWQMPGCRASIKRVLSFMRKYPCLLPRAAETSSAMFQSHCLRLPMVSSLLHSDCQCTTSTSTCASFHDTQGLVSKVERNSSACKGALLACTS